jgi:hypothetical protein
MAVLRIEQIAKKLTNALKRHLLAKKQKKVTFIEVTDNEANDNALNEALEARLMESIATSPELEAPVTLEMSFSFTPSSPAAHWPVFDFSTLPLSTLPQYSTRCQAAQAQTA